LTKNKPCGLPDSRGGENIRQCASAHHTTGTLENASGPKKMKGQGGKEVSLTNNKGKGSKQGRKKIMSPTIQSPKSFSTNRCNDLYKEEMEPLGREKGKFENKGKRREHHTGQKKNIEQIKHQGIDGT